MENDYKLFTLSRQQQETNNERNNNINNNNNENSSQKSQLQFTPGKSLPFTTNVMDDDDDDENNNNDEFGLSNQYTFSTRKKARRTTLYNIPPHQNEIVSLPLPNNFETNHTTSPLPNLPSPEIHNIEQYTPLPSTTSSTTVNKLTTKSSQNRNINNNNNEIGKLIGRPQQTLTMVTTNYNNIHKNSNLNNNNNNLISSVPNKNINNSRFSKATTALPPITTPLKNTTAGMNSGFRPIGNTPGFNNQNKPKPTTSTTIGIKPQQNTSTLGQRPTLTTSNARMIQSTPNTKVGGSVTSTINNIGKNINTVKNNITTTTPKKTATATLPVVVEKVNTVNQTPQRPQKNSISTSTDQNRTIQPVSKPRSQLFSPGTKATPFKGKRRSLKSLVQSLSGFAPQKEGSNASNVSNIGTGKVESVLLVNKTTTPAKTINKPNTSQTTLPKMTTVSKPAASSLFSPNKVNKPVVPAVMSSLNANKNKMADSTPKKVGLTGKPTATKL
jgi:hypothetical protein